MQDMRFTPRDKEVIQEVVKLLGGREEAECCTCSNWQKFCYKPANSVCACHSSAAASGACGSRAA